MSDKPEITFNAEVNNGRIIVDEKNWEYTIKDFVDYPEEQLLNTPPEEYSFYQVVPYMTHTRWGQEQRFMIIYRKEKSL